MDKSITIVAIDTDPVTHPLVKYAIQTTIRHVNAEKILFFGEKPLGLGETFVRINPLKSVNDYSSFVLKSLWPFVDSEYALIVQWDGFAVNADGWTNEFLSVDYIGAPWTWAEGNKVVGNGGFSLRSAKLINACKDGEVSQNSNVPFGMIEDVLICRYFREHFEKQGLRFAPLELATRFSYEMGVRSHDTFGFHGLANMPLYVPEKDLLENANSLLLKIKTKSQLRFEAFKQSCVAMNYREMLALLMTAEQPE